MDGASKCFFGEERGRGSSTLRESLTMPNLLRYLKLGRVLLGMRSHKREEAIRELVALLDGGTELRRPKQFLSSLIRQENELGTVAEHGVALAHCRDDAVLGPAICIGTLQEGIDLQDADESVRILVVVAWPLKHQGLYLSAVAELARLLREESVRDRLLEARTPEEALAVLR